MHDEDARNEYVPVEHATHDVNPAVAVYVPAAQYSHAAPTELYEVAGQAT